MTDAQDNIVTHDSAGAPNRGREFVQLRLDPKSKPNE